MYLNEGLALKIVYKVIREASRKWTISIWQWKQALNHVAILFDGRMPKKCKSHPCGTDTIDFQGLDRQSLVCDVRDQRRPWFRELPIASPNFNFGYADAAYSSANAGTVPATAPPCAGTARYGPLLTTLSGGPRVLQLLKVRQRLSRQCRQDL